MGAVVGACLYRNVHSGMPFARPGTFAKVNAMKKRAMVKRPANPDRGGRGHGLVMAAVGLLLWQAWTGYREVCRRRLNERPAAQAPALQRWEGEGGQPLPAPPPH